jgi:hypothetical protein
VTKKDYVVIAAVLDRIRLDFDMDGEDTVSLSLVAEELATALADTNPRFDRARFLTACGMN